MSSRTSTVAVFVSNETSASPTPGMFVRSS